jgi:type IV pilus assembly protein PilA
MFSKMPKRGEKGFTLVELLITIAVVGVLAAIAIPLYAAQTDQANKASAIADGRAWASVVSTELTDYTNFGTAPGNTTTAITLGTVTTGTATLTITLAAPTPSSPTSQTATVAVSPGTTITASGMSATQFCFITSNNGQTAVFNQRGYQAGLTTCSAAGAVS